MENCPIKKISFGADMPENATVRVPWENGPLGILVTSRRHNSSEWDTADALGHIYFVDVKSGNRLMWA